MARDFVVDDGGAFAEHQRIHDAEPGEVESLNSMALIATRLADHPTGHREV